MPMPLKPLRGRTQLFADHHAHAGGPTHYAAYLENEDVFEVELMTAAYRQAGSTSVGERPGAEGRTRRAGSSPEGEAR